MVRGILFLLLAVTEFAIAQNNSVITKNIVSQFDEQAPVMSPDGRHLFYTIAHNEHNVGGTKDAGDIWYAVWQDSIWSMPFHAGAVINNKGWNGVLGFSPDGSIYLHHHYQDGKQGISIAQKRGDYWEKPVNVPIPYFRNTSRFQSGCISPDGQVMLLALETYGTIGGEDIYVSFKNGDKWTEPKNVGSVINTRFQEMTPIIAADNRTVYFSSNGLRGKGSMDVFKTTRLDDSWMLWSKPANVKNINTEGREQSFNLDGERQMMWYVSTTDSDGYGDIKFIKSDTVAMQPAEVVEDVVDSLIMNEETVMNDPVFWRLYGKVMSEENGTGLSAQLVYLSEIRDTVIRTATNPEGIYQVKMDSNGPYKLKVSAKGYLPGIATLVLDSSSYESEFNYVLKPVEIGEAVKLDNVLFEKGKSVMLPSSYPDLEAVYALLSENPTMEIELSGHTDNQGSSKLNLKLSQERVDVVKQYLVDKGVSSKRISGKGYGSQRPIASNKNPETRMLNRRVEITVLKE